MDDIDFLEHGGGNAMVRHHGDLISLPDPRARHYQWVLLALHLRHVPGIPADIPEWKRALAFDRWAAAWDLPSFEHARRLAYLVDKYRSAVANDLQVHAGLDLGALWRARRWQHLLDVIDHLPAHSWYAATVSMDQEHADMMAEAIMKQRADGKDDPASEAKGPHLTQWTPEVSALNNVLDAVNGVRHAVIAVQAGNKAPEPPKPAPRPQTPLEATLKRLEFERRKAAHESLAARVLKHKRQSQDPVH